MGFFDDFNFKVENLISKFYSCLLGKRLCLASECVVRAATLKKSLAEECWKHLTDLTEEKG